MLHKYRSEFILILARLALFPPVAVGGLAARAATWRWRWAVLQSFHSPFRPSEKLCNMANDSNRVNEHESVLASILFFFIFLSVFVFLWTLCMEKKCLVIHAEACGLCATVCPPFLLALCNLHRSCVVVWCVHLYGLVAVYRAVYMLLMGSPCISVKNRLT